MSEDCIARRVVAYTEKQWLVFFYDEMCVVGKIVHMQKEGIAGYQDLRVLKTFYLFDECTKYPYSKK